MNYNNTLILHQKQLESHEHALQALTSGRDMLVSKPTGSGKSVEIVALSSVLVPLGYKVVVAVPLLNIADNISSRSEKFFTKGHSTLSITSFLEKEEPGDLDAYLEAEDPQGALVITQQALTLYMGQPVENRFSVAEKAVLIIDEFHRSRASGLEVFINWWRSAGGLVVGYTATPWRSDGKEVGWLDEVREDGSYQMSMYYLPLAEHMADVENGIGRFCPSKLVSEFITYESNEDVEEEREVRMEENAQAFANKVYEKNRETGHPKAIVYINTSSRKTNEAYREAVIRRFSQEGLTALDATGPDAEEFEKALVEERGREHGESRFALIVGNGRVREGTDWAHCSAIYCHGMPGSSVVLVQLFGRACRKKNADYKPAEYRDVAEITFFFGVRHDTDLDEMLQRHSHNLLALCCYITDCRLQVSSILKRISAGIITGLQGHTEHEGSIPEVKDQAGRELLKNDIITEENTKVTAAVVKLAGEGATVGEIREKLVDQGYDQDKVDLVLVKQISTDKPDELIETIAAEKTKALVTGGRMTRLAVQNISKEVFADYVHLFRDKTLVGSKYERDIQHQLHRVINLKQVVTEIVGKEKTSKYPGVSFHKRDGKWQAQITIEGKKKNLGSFETEEEARNVVLNPALANVQERKEKTSKYPGVSFAKASGKWQAYITVEGKKKSLGYYETEEEARNVVLNPAMANVKERKEKTSKYPGVSFAKARGKWIAYITIEDKRKNLGYYETEEEAYQVVLNPALAKVKERKEKSSKYPGVCFHKANGKWQAYITVEGKKKKLGYYETEEEAHKVVLKAKGEGQS